MMILTDFPRFPKKWKTSGQIEGVSRTSLAGASPKDLFQLIPDFRQADFVLVNMGGLNVYWLILLFWAFPFLKKPIIAVDIILRRPHTVKEKLIAWFKKILLKRVDHFVHYFRALDGYEKIYGISSEKSSYVPFKANIFGDHRVPKMLVTEKEEYVFSAGWSLRDYDTFFKAVSQLDYPAAIPEPNFQSLKEHGSRFTWRLENLPRNLVLLEHDGSSQESWIRNLCKARVVVIPILRDSICSRGISVYMDAMLLKKCVIISSGPGVSDVLTDQAIIVAPEDPVALAQAIRKVWEDPVLRSEVSLRGYRYATSLGGEPELLNRVLEQSVNWYINCQTSSRISVKRAIADTELLGLGKEEPNEHAT
jgi:glycosyltransferase involved in cell wall biosynthesis